MAPRKKIAKKAGGSKTPSSKPPTSSATESPDSTTPDVNSITMGDAEQCAAPEGSPSAQISLPGHGDSAAITSNDDKLEMDIPPLDGDNEALPVTTNAMATDQEDSAGGGTPAAVDSGVLAPEKSPPSVLSQEHSSTDVSSSGVAATDSPVGDATTAQDVKPSDSKPGIPPRKKIVKKVVKIVRKVPVKKTPATETPDNTQSAVIKESTDAAVSLPKDGGSETITTNDDKPETEIPTESSKDSLPSAAADVEAPAVDATPMVLNSNETPASDGSHVILPSEPTLTNALCSGESTVKILAGDTVSSVTAPGQKPNSTSAGKGKKVVVRKVVKSRKSLVPGKSPDVSTAKAPSADDTPSAAEDPEAIAAGDPLVTVSQDPSSMGASLDVATSEVPTVSHITPSSVLEPEPSSKPSGTGRKVVVKKVKKLVKKVVKVVKKGGEVKKVEEVFTEKDGENQNNTRADPAYEGERGLDLDSSHGVTGGNTKEEKVPLGNSASSGLDATTSLGKHRRKTEVFIGGLDRYAKEDDLREVFGKAGEIVEVRLMMDGTTGKNKGYAFVRYATASQAKRAVSEFAKVEVCGKICGAAALEGDDRIFLGNIDKKWKKEDIMKLLEQMGIEKIDALTLLSNPSNATLNRGFAFLEFENNRDAQIAYKKLQKNNAFGKGMNVKVAWADPLNEPDEEDMQKVKSIFVEGIPSAWTEENLKPFFEKYGEIERIVLACNMPSAKRKDFAFVNYTTREAARCCIDSFVKEELTENGSKVNIKVSLAKPVPKGKKTKGDAKSISQDISKDTANTYKRNIKPNANIGKGPNAKRNQDNAAGAKPSTTTELLHVLREQASWKHGPVTHVGAASGPGYPYATPGVKRQSSALESAPYSDPRSYPRPRLEGAYPFSNPSAVPSGVMGTSLPYQYRPHLGYVPGGVYGGSDASQGIQSKYNAASYGKHHSLY